MSAHRYRNQGEAIDTRAPEREAVVEIRGDRTRRLTYAQLDVEIEAGADALAGRRLPAGSRIAILGQNSADWLIAFYAVQRAGHVAVPVSYRLPPDGLSNVLQNAGAVLVLAEDPGALGAVVSQEVEVVGLTTFTRSAPAAPPAVPAGEPTGQHARGGAVPPAEAASRHPRTGTDAAMILYTSGSTGYPKGVELSQDSHLWVIDVALERGIDPAARFVVAAPLYHMNALSNVQAALAAGATAVVLDRFEPRAFLAAVAVERGTRVTGVPPMFAMVLAESDLVASLDLGCVEEVFVGSAPAGPELLMSIERLFPRAVLQFGYGTTESGPVAFGTLPGRTTPRGSVGAASPLVELRLVDPQGREDPRRGVLQIRCPALMTGYYRRPDVRSPVTADGYFDTRDVFEVDPDGYYFFVGRDDDAFSCGGENVYPRAVEQVLESHPGVLHAAVVPVPDATKGAKPVAFVVTTAAQDGSVQPDEGALREHALRHVEPYAHPRRVFFVDALPLGPTNKVDRHELAEQATRLLAVAAPGGPS